MTTGQVNSKGQIIADRGIRWEANRKGFWSVHPGGYFIEHVAPNVSGGDIIAGSRHGLVDDPRWTLFRLQPGALGSETRQPIMRGKISQCMQVAEIYEIRRTPKVATVGVASTRTSAYTEES